MIGVIEPQAGAQVGQGLEGGGAIQAPLAEQIPQHIEVDAAALGGCLHRQGIGQHEHLTRAEIIQLAPGQQGLQFRPELGQAPPQAGAGALPFVEAAVAIPAAIEPNGADRHDQQLQLERQQRSAAVEQVALEEEIGVDRSEGGQQSGAVDRPFLRQFRAGG